MTTDEATSRPAGVSLEAEERALLVQALAAEVPAGEVLLRAAAQIVPPGPELRRLFARSGLAPWCDDAAGA